MFKHISLSLSLCLLAMGLNSLLVTPSDAQQQPQQSAQNVTNGSTTLIEQGSYVNREGYSVHKPAHTVSGAVPAGASAQCRDGSYSFSMNHRGTCSHHGGVARWL
ncbi:DUF3761 domain-containing protein [Rhodanobacter sp. A1T4]|uniref:DUF3761 domain-containing protein n=1 Tax=Rhodanobacter sp. A1T4 TaxID=2723087 RepID=UPI00185A0AC6|nr:DUF3761 domain-containing protein [Rhodanobacter sp. A1T4]MBB6245516.1 hypothetical protein [Rhodanobacter sp. A1T4]